MQFSTLGRLNNINEQGFSLEDYIELMGGLEGLSSGALAIDPSELGISFDGTDRRQGFLKTGALGTNLNYDFNEQTDFSFNYFYNYFDKEEDKTINRTSFLEENQTFTNDEESFQNSINKNHRLNSRLKFEIDSSQDIELRVNMNLNDRLLDRQSQILIQNDLATQNNSEQLTDTENNLFGFNSSLLYRKRLQKKGRSLVSKIDFENRSADGRNFVRATNVFNEFTDLLDQQQDVDNGQWSYSGRLTYTEPIGKSNYLALNYNRRNYEERMDKDFLILWHRN